MPASQKAQQEQARQELQVRLTAQDILLRNLRRVAAWPGMRLDLTGALLFEFSLTGCQLNYASLTRAQFTGKTTFGEVEFTSTADFSGAQFASKVDFGFAEFTGPARFDGARFIDRANFESAQFMGFAIFKGTQFADNAHFEGTRFTRGAFFTNAKFTGLTHFGDALFNPYFEDTRFNLAAFEGARVASPAASSSVWPPNWTTRPAIPGNGEDPAFLYLTRPSYSPPTHNPSQPIGESYEKHSDP